MSTLASTRSGHASDVDSAAQRRLHCLVAEFETVDQILDAAHKVSDAGYTRWDTHTPFPVHGLDDAMKVRRTILPWLVMIGGIAGCATGIGMQWYMNAADPSWGIFNWLWTFIQPYNYPISGKPDWSFPANVPVIFELTVLFSAITAVFGMFVLNDLPLFYNPLFNSTRIQRATDDRFFVSIDARDPRFNLEHTEAMLESLRPVGGVERVYEYPSEPWPPAFMRIHVPVITGLLALIPLAVIIVGWTSKKSEPRIHIIQDMDNQEKFKTQKLAVFFNDRLAMRPIPDGALARGDLQEDGHFFRGVVGSAWAESFPLHRKEIVIDDAFMARGREKFNIYCASCHGRDGAGEGMVHQRSAALGGTDGTAWVQPSNLHEQDFLERPVGHLYNTISNGIRSMPSYGDKLRPADRWAVVAYVRALQRSQHATLTDVPADKRSELQGR